MNEEQELREAETAQKLDEFVVAWVEDNPELLTERGWHHPAQPPFDWSNLSDEHKRQLEAEGWTPPAEKQEPEFKEGDYCIFGNGVGKLARYTHRQELGNKAHIDEDGQGWVHCKHADSWLKPESGPVPPSIPGLGFTAICHNVGHGLFLRVTDDGRYWLEHNGKWCWLPLED